MSLLAGAPLVNTAFEWKAAPGCTAAAGRDGGTFNVLSLSWDVAARSKDDIGSVTDIHLGYTAGPTSESVTETCGKPHLLGPARGRDRRGPDSGSGRRTQRPGSAVPGDAMGGLGRRVFRQEGVDPRRPGDLYHQSGHFQAVSQAPVGIPHHLGYPVSAPCRDRVFDGCAGVWKAMWSGRPVLRRTRVDIPVACAIICISTIGIAAT
jgi:hypothetical protein